MNILIVNQPLNNRGDESAHKGLVRRLSKQYPKAEINVLFVSANQDSVNQFNPHLDNVHYLNIQEKFKFHRFSIPVVKSGRHYMWKIHPVMRKIMKLYKRADLVVCAPGGICMGGFQNWKHLFFLDIAKYLGKKIAYYGRSFGPFPTESKDNKLFRKISLLMLDYFSFCSIRDSKTEALAKQLNVKYIPTVDSAFLDSPQVDIPCEILDVLENKPYVVFVPNLLIWHYAYKNRIKKETVLYYFSRILDEINSVYPEENVVMLPQTFNYGNYRGDDINFFRDLATYVKKDNLKIIPDTYSSDIQQAIISKSNCMIGARYHSIVFALNQSVPFVALSYEHKISGLLESLGKKDCMIDITHALDDQRAIDTSILDFKLILKKVKPDFRACEKAKSIANNCFLELTKFIKNTYDQ